MQFAPLRGFLFAAFARIFISLCFFPSLSLSLSPFLCIHVPIDIITCRDVSAERADMVDLPLIYPPFSLALWRHQDLLAAFEIQAIAEDIDDAKNACT